MKGPIFLFMLVLVITTGAFSQETSATEKDLLDPKIALFRSLAVPGWGHHYVNPDNWTRGRYHLAAEATLILSYIGFRLHSNKLEQNWLTYADKEAGVEIEGRNRSFQLAVGDFNSLREYNEFQERSRNWDRFLADIPQNRWSWRSDRDREQYRDLRERFERLDRQLPALLSLMVVNRIVSAVSAYNRAKKANEPAGTTALYFSTHGMNGIVANLQIEI